MRKHLSLAIPIAAAAMLLLAWPATAQVAPSAAAGAGIKDSAHDFTRYDAAGNSQNVGLCTFCHTPHKAIQTQLLWNHTLSSEVFDWTDSDTTQGGTDRAAIQTSWAGPTKFCLSCHDGTVAIGDINWFDKQAWAGAGSELNAVKHDGVNDPYRIAGAGGELKGNHPVAHPFPYNNAAGTYNGATSGTMAVASGWVANPDTLGIRLFTDDGSGGITAGPTASQTGIECSSCHDPHNGANKVYDSYFLRGKLTGNTATDAATGYICLKCHAK